MALEATNTADRMGSKNPAHKRWLKVFSLFTQMCRIYDIITIDAAYARRHSSTKCSGKERISWLGKNRRTTTSYTDGNYLTYRGNVPYMWGSYRQLEFKGGIDYIYDERRLLAQEYDGSTEKGIYASTTPTGGG